MTDEMLTMLAREALAAIRRTRGGGCGEVVDSGPGRDLRGDDSHDDLALVNR